MYEFLKCTQTTPCYVWMNPDPVARAAGDKRAAELSAVYNEIIQSHTYENFDMFYTDFPLPQIIKKWESMGGQAWELIEPSDGFHP